MTIDVYEQIVHWTARVAVSAWLVRLLADLAGWPADAARRARRERLVRGVWTLGCVAYLLHVAAAFQFVHDWSHTAATAHTARQTAAVTGWDLSGGLWINYLFTLWWPLDVVWSWRRRLDRLPRWYVIGMHSAVGFLVFNATAVFGPTWWRWAVVPICGLLIAMSIRRRASIA